MKKRPTRTEAAYVALVEIVTETVDQHVSAGLKDWAGDQAVLEALIQTGQLAKICELAPPGQGGKLLVAWIQVTGHPAAKAIARELEGVRTRQATTAEAWLRKQLGELGQ